MGRYAFCIFIGAFLVLIFAGAAKMDAMQRQQLKPDAFEFVNTGNAKSFCRISSDEGHATDFDSAFGRIMATDIKSCMPKTFKFLSAIRILSSLNTCLPGEGSKILYFGTNYVKCSSSYFVYTLRRILI